jgi:hypothetical protein
LGPAWTGNGRTYLRIPVLINYYKPNNSLTKNKTYNSEVRIELYDCNSKYSRSERIVLSSEKFDFGVKVADFDFLNEKESPWGRRGPIIGDKVFSETSHLCN